MFANGTVWQQEDNIAPGDYLPAKVLLVQIGSTLGAYIFGQFACKFNIQLESFALPMLMVGPVTLCGIVTLCYYRQEDPCALSPTIPDYIFYQVTNYRRVTSVRQG